MINTTDTEVLEMIDKIAACDPRVKSCLSPESCCLLQRGHYGAEENCKWLLTFYFLKSKLDKMSLQQSVLENELT